MRARNLKPGFFKNEDLAELPFEARLLFVGLWCMADREGRLEDRPKHIKIEVFPADDVDVEKLLGMLAGVGLIIRYSVDGGRYIVIPKFLCHQNPHKQERPSIIPAPGDIEKLLDNFGTTSEVVEKLTEVVGLNPESPSLNPESPSLNPESLYTATPQREDAGTLTAFYVDAMHCAQQVLTDADKGQFARYAGQVLKQGCAYQDAINATRKMIEKGLAPRLLGQLVNEVRAGPKIPANVAAALKLVQECGEGA